MRVFKWIIFLAGTVGIAWVSRTSLRNVRSHGFFRFFAWEFMLVLFLYNVNFWFLQPFSIRQIFSWLALFLSLPLVLLGVQAFIHKGKVDRVRDAPALLGIEKTTRLVTSGVYKYIRHPFYSSLLFLAWGIFLKRISFISILLTATVMVFLVLTAKREEIEDIAFFGEKYRAYMQDTKMFIPYIL